MGDVAPLDHHQKLARAQRTLLSNLWHPQKHRICLRRSKYMVVRMASRALRWSTVKEDKDSSVVWLDRWESGDLMNLAPPRKMGHIPGVAELGTKCSIGKALNRIRAEFPLDYDFHPVSFILPAERAKLREFDATYRGLARSVRSKEKAGAAAAAAAGVPYLPPPLPQPPRVASPGPSQSSPATSSSTPPAPSYPLLSPPPTGCWPAPGTQAQPLPGRDRLVYIVKPDGGARGQGIYLALTLDDIEEAGEGFTLEDGVAGGGKNQQQGGGGGDDDGNSDDDDGEVQASSTARRPVMVQAYLPRPLLMDGRKFDLRIYVLVTSVYPTLRVFVYKQGLVRFATVQYEAPSEANVAQRRMFLTNYAVNKPGDRPRSPKPWDEPEPETSPSSLSSSTASTASHSLLGRGWKEGGVSPGGFSAGTAAAAAGGGFGVGASKRPPPAMVIVDPPPGDETDEGDDIDDSEEVILSSSSKGGGGKGASGVGPPDGSMDSDGEWDGGPRVSSNMRGWEAPGEHHQSPLPPRDGKVEIVRAQAGCKWTLSALFQCLEAQGVDTEVLWERVKDCIFKTLLSVRASLASKYRAARPTLRKDPPPGFVVEREAAAARVREAAKRVAFKASRAKSMELAQLRAAEKARLASEAVEAARVASEAAAAVGGGGAFEPPLPLPSLRVTRDEYNHDIMKVLMGPGVGASGGGGGVLARGGAFSGVGSGASLRGLTLTGKGLNQGGDFSGGGGGGGVRGRAMAKEMQLQQQGWGGDGGGGGLDFTVTGRKMNLAGPTSAAAALAAATATAASSKRGLGGGSLPPLPTTTLLLPTPVISTPFSSNPPAVGSALALARSGQSRSSSQRSSSVDSSSDSARTSPASSAPLPSTSSTPTGGSGGSGGGGGKPPSSSAAAAAAALKVGGGASAAAQPPPSTRPPPMNPADREAAAAAAALAAAAAAAGATGLEEEDGEQGFRAFEFMGLDVILDMSHCSCVPELVGYDPQRVASFKGARGEKAKGCPINRCQPKPVLLEINQSCSMHTDSDLDRIVKGDALRDGLTMVAPDERWLLESFVGAIKELGGLAGAANAAANAAMGGEPMTPPPTTAAAAAAAASNSSGSTPFPWSSIPTPPPCCDATLFSTVAGARAALEDPSKDPILTRKTCTATPLDTRASLNDFPDLHASVVKSSHRALEESSRLLSQWPRGYPTPNLEKGERWEVEGGGGGAAGGGSSAATPTTPSSSSPFNLAAMVRSTDTIPWVPPPLQPLFAAHQAVWNEEFWFGLKHHEIFLAAATGSKALANTLAGIGAGGSGGEGEVTTTPLPTPASMRPSSPLLASRSAGGTSSGSSSSSSSGGGGSGGILGGGSGDSCNIPSLSTIPALSPRAALVLLLRRLYECRHAGGFERVSPPAHPGLAARYKAIAEFVPPSLRETAAYARRRAEALALRASSDKALLKGGQGGGGVGR